MPSAIKQHSFYPYCSSICGCGELSWRPEGHGGDKMQARDAYEEQSQLDSNELSTLEILTFLKINLNLKFGDF